MIKSPANLTPRGWALLVMAGGCALAILFFRRPANDPYVSSGDITARRSPSEERISLSCGENRAISSEILPKASETSIGSEVGRTSEKLSTNNSAATSAVVSGNTPSVLIPNKATVSVDDLPAPKSAAVEKTGLEKKSATVTIEAVSPINDEYPAWAKRPSLMDSLLANQHEGVLTDLPAARKPTAFQSWTPEIEEQGSAEQIRTDRYTPFGSADANVSLSKSSELEKKFLWPDEDPRAAEVTVKPERLVGRDAVIRDPAQLVDKNSPASPPRAAADFGHIPSHSNRPASAVLSSGGNTDPASLSSTMFENGLIQQPQFGRSDHHSARSGASLRRHLPPNDNQLIRQPGLPQSFGNEAISP